MTLTIGGVEIGGDNPCRFVAEISNNHGGDRDRCGRLIDAAKAAGADFCKFQCYTADELIALRGDGPAPEPWHHLTMRELYSRAATPLDWFPKIAAHCERVGMPWFSSVFGPESLAVLEANDCPAYKVARLDNDSEILRVLEQRARIAYLRGTPHKPLIVSRDNLWHANDDVTLYCPAGYPQERFGFDCSTFASHGCSDCAGSYFDGFSFHGTDPLPCVVAATLGAKMIEAHFQLDDEPSELEANVSLTASQFAQMIRDVRRVEAMLA